MLASRVIAISAVAFHGTDAATLRAWPGMKPANGNTPHGDAAN